MDIRTTDENKIEAYVFERHIDVRGLDAVKEALAEAPGVRFVGQFVGAFNLFARVVADELEELQDRIAGAYSEAGVRSAWSVNLTGPKPTAPKRHSPDVCALVCVQATVDPFQLLETIDERFVREGAYGGAVVNAADFDLLIDLGADSIEDVLDRVIDLRAVPGIGRTSTALGDVSKAIRPTPS